MKKILIVFLLFFTSLFASAQQFGNEWINYSQKYFFVKVVNNGVYLIDYNTLVNAGIPISSINPKNFQMFGKEKELFIHVEGEQDNVFDPGDYIEFYGEKNDGWLDTVLYGGTQFMADTYYSLYNDTLRYYVTWNSDTTNRRMVNETDTDFASYSPINYVWYNSFAKLTDHYLPGQNSDGSSNSLFTSGEGWFSDIFNGVSGGAAQNISIPNPDIYLGPGSPNVKANSSSASASDASFSGLGNHHLEINYGSSNIIALDTVFIGYKLIKESFDIVPTDLNSPSTNFQFRIIDDQGALTDYQAIGSVSLKYPHTLNFVSSTTFNCVVPFNSSESKSRLDISNFSVNNPTLYVLTDTVKRISVSGVANNHQVLIPNHFSGKEQEIYLTEQGSIININSIYPVNSNGNFTNYGVNPVDSAFIIFTQSSLLTEAGNYANYRSSLAGGGYNTLLVNVEELYDQYGGGIQKHSLALRRFCADVINDWGNTPSNLFIIGKGIREATESSNGTFHGTRKDPIAFQESLVPSFGYPASDVLITSGILSGNFTPAIPTGRLAAKNGGEVTTYLNKVIEYETSQNAPLYDHEEKAWMKHILHFSGGANSQEQLNFGIYLQQFENIAEDSLFGGYVNTFVKETSSPINPVDFSQISGFLEEGVSLMTFFGHASSAGFDQNIDAPSNWNNQGKYPLLLGNGCYAGDIYQPTSISNSEEFVLIPNRGTIGFLSTSKVGFAGPLYIFSEEFYRQFGYKNYGQTIGYHLQKTVEYMENSWPAFLNNNVAMQMALHGDPAVKINYHKEPEFVVRTQDVFYDPPIVSLGVDSINVNVVVTNLGRSSSDSIQVELVRHFPNDNGDSLYFKSFSGIKFIDTIIFRIPVLHNLSTGINIFDVAVDIPSTVTEVYDELNNNQTSSTLFINSNGIATIYPYEFAIIPDSIVVFKASTLNPLATPRDYRFELDTTDLFNSPFKRFAIINAPGGVLELDGANWLNQSTGLLDPLMHTDSTVYYWRVSPDSTTFIWDESSFQYIPNQTGWGQAHFFQFKNNVHQALNYDRPTRSWIWDETYRTFKIDVYSQGNNPIEWTNTLWEMDGALQEYDGCFDPVFYPSIHIAVVDPVTLEAWTTEFHNYGNSNPIGACRTRPEGYFIYRQNDPVSMDSLIGFYNNYVPPGHYVMFYTYNFTNYAAWQPNHFAFFQSIGADSIYSGRPDETWIYYTQKGNNSGFNGYTSGNTPNQLVTISDTLTSLEYQGNMISEIAGPARRWDALYWQQEAKENPTYDSTQLILIGIKYDGTKDTLINTPFTSLDSIINLNSIVDANIYPWVKLEGHFYDDQLFTPAQTQRWQLLYQPVPEIAVNPPLGYYFSIVNDTIYEGQDIELAVAIENVSPYDMDSLLVHYWIEDQNRVLNYVNYPRQDSLLSGEFLYDTISISSEGYPGLNSIWVEANPIPFDDSLGNYDQLEQYHFNNYLQIPFYVNQDLINPILDVTFDGIHILNGDIVSGKPLILVTLKDENPFLVMNESRDTAHFAVYLTDPVGNQQRIYFNQGVNQVMNFIPSTGPNDKFKIEYNPSLLTDGKYQLLIQATDKSGNESGDIDYKIDFEVINHSTITEVMNYPNPFSTKTHFVFTLTGNTIPDYFKIQIMTISGKIVREIMVDELGPIHIGRNITEYAWDGRDEFGDLLANGIYLYRVITKINEEAIEKRESGADQFFKKGFGKMTLIR